MKRLESSARTLTVLIATPNDADAALARDFLRDANIKADAVSGLADLCPLLGGDVGCVILVEETLFEPDIFALQQALGSQPAWSDLPLLLIAGQGTPLSALVERVFPESGNITLLQRPLHPVSLVSAVYVALRARERQFEVRDLLEQRARALRQRDEFLAMLAHELRNPLAPVRNAVYLLNSLSIPDPLFAKARSLIDRQVQHMSRLVDDLLDVSRLEVGKVELHLKPLDLNRAVSAAAEICVPLTAGNHNLVLRLERQPLCILADPVRVEQIISNLISNAAKFTPPAGTITIETRQEGDAAVVVVADDGIGIPAEMLESIFDLFSQADITLARSGGGLGIGLTVVQRLMTLHHGTIEAESEGTGKGSRFVARFPLVRDEAMDERRSQPPALNADRPGKRVLVVEDNADIRDTLGLLLTMWRHEVEFAETGPDGVRRARESRPDVALIDIGLPGLDGYGVARQIRSMGCPWSRRVRLIALTGYGQASDREKAAAAGFDLHLLKPVDPKALENLLQTADCSHAMPEASRRSG